MSPFSSTRPDATAASSVSAPARSCNITGNVTASSATAGVTGSGTATRWSSRGSYGPGHNNTPSFAWRTAAREPSGVEACWARPVSALVRVGGVLLTYGIAKRLYGRTAGIVAAIVLGSCFQFIAAGRFGTSDMLLTFFLSGTPYPYRPAQDHPPGRAPRAWSCVCSSSGGARDLGRPLRYCSGGRAGSLR